MLVQDADMEYDPFEYTILLEPNLKGKADVVYGSRFKGDTSRIWCSLFFQTCSQISTYRICKLAIKFLEARS